MLRFLSLRDFVIVDALELPVDRGFTVLTGETGAGKSILVDALGLVLGARADALVVRRGAKRAEIAAEFEIGGLPATRTWLEQSDLADEGVCLLRRVIEDSGRSRAFINGRPVTLSQLRELGDLLVDIHGQHEHQKLLKADAQRDLLDAYANGENAVRHVGASYRAWRHLRELRIAREEDDAASAREREELAWQIQELAGLGFSAEQWETLQNEHSRLANAAALIETSQESLATLDDSEAAALTQVDAVVGRLARGAEVDAALAPVLEMARSASADLREAIRLLRQYRDRLELDPQRLADADRRIAAIHEQARKHRVEVLRLPELLRQKEERLAALGGTSSLDDLRQREGEAETVYFVAAKKLSALRVAAAKKLAAGVTASLQDLAMQGGRLDITLAACEPSSHGLEQCEFLVAAHQGQVLGPLAKIASGGELSRIGLAIQVLASTRAGIPTLIFDEVDAGIGGRVAEFVGRLLAELGHRHQVLCVTHLAQVAACADRQLRISKEAHDGAALSHAAALDKADRIEEIARMLGGIRITAATRKHAEEMLLNAQGSATPGTPGR